MEDLLLLHGAAGSAAQLEKLQQRLERHFRIYTFNFPGHGGSQMPESFSINLFSDALGSFCRQHSLHNVAVFGYSMGGFVALDLSLKQPGIFSRIITLGTKFHWNEQIAAKEISMLQPSLIGEKLPAFAAFLEKLHHPNSWREVLEKTGLMLGELGKISPVRDESLQKISCPVLLMSGDQDRMVQPAETIAAAGNIPGSQCAILPATPHPLEKADTDLLAFMIRRFVEA